MAEFDEQLICAVKEYPCLYNTKLNDFKVTWKKENAWKVISKQLNYTVDVTSKRWKALRERYTKEHKKIKRPTGTGAEEVAKEWQFYHLMDFLKDFVRHRNTVSNLCVSIESVSDHKTDDSATTDTPPQSLSGPPTLYEDPVTDGADSVVEELEKSINVEKTSTQSGKSSPRTHPIAPHRPKKKRKIEMDPFEEEILRQLKESNKLPQSESNDDLSFGRIIALNLKRLQPQQKAEAKIKIHQLLYELEFTTPATPPFSHALPHYQGIPYSGINPPYYSFCPNGAPDPPTDNDD